MVFMIDIGVSNKGDWRNEKSIVMQWYDRKCNLDR